MNGKIVCIDGNIGAGKSTLLEELENRGYYVFKEDISKWGALLDKFYTDPKRWGFTLQIAVMNSLHDQFQEIKKLRNENAFVFVERSPETSMIFGKNSLDLGYISPDEFILYEECFKKFVWYADVKFYIDTNIDTCMQRIMERGRLCEKNLDIEYLERIYAEYKNISFHEYFPGHYTASELADNLIHSLRKY